MAGRVFDNHASRSGGALASVALFFLILLSCNDQQYVLAKMMVESKMLHSTEALFLNKNGKENIMSTMMAENQNNRIASSLQNNMLSSLGRRLRKDKPLVTEANAFGSVEDACCACFKSKYAWPVHAGLDATFGGGVHTCDTCYATDIYDVGSKSSLVFNVPAKPVDLEKTKGSSSCVDLCDEHPEGCGYTTSDTNVHYSGAGACQKLLADAVFVEQMGRGKPVCENGFVAEMCPVSCNVENCGTSDSSSGKKQDGHGYQKTEQSKVMAVHEWNWNCASGKAPEDPAEWLAGPVVGEPSTRGPFIMCKESAGWYCPFEIDADLMMKPGADVPEEVDEGGSDVTSVETMSLPVI